MWSRQTWPMPLPRAVRKKHLRAQLKLEPVAQCARLGYGEGHGESGGSLTRSAHVPGSQNESGLTNPRARGAAKCAVVLQQTQGIALPRLLCAAIGAALPRLNVGRFLRPRGNMFTMPRVAPSSGRGAEEGIVFQDCMPCRAGPVQLDVSAARGKLLPLFPVDMHCLCILRLQSQL